MSVVEQAGPISGVDGDDRLAELLESMRPEILSFARRRVGVTRADEILSDVELAALRATHSGRQISAGWLITVARNKVIDHWRRAERHERLIERMKAQCPVLEPHADEFVGETPVTVTLRSLRPQHRSILVRHYVHGEPVGAMARSDGMSYRAMESAMARARRAFRESHAIAS